MEEAGIADAFEEAVESQGQGQSQSQAPPPSHHRNQNQHKTQVPNQSPTPLPPNLGLMGIPPPNMLNLSNMGNMVLPNQLPPMIPGQNIVHNPALANVLANLHIPSTTIHPTKDWAQNQNQDEEGCVSQYQKLGQAKSQQNNSRRSPPAQQQNSQSPPSQSQVTVKQEKVETEPPEHLPPMQKELFRRIQEQQIKHEKKSVGLQLINMFCFVVFIIF
jgi:hypothetical protein